jgi:hypothetical protein
MRSRMNFYQAAPDTIKALSGLEAQVVSIPTANATDWPRPRR